ncbi:SDR family NAD(P)-dependent oxidoreductase [Tsukamurella serpentis]
MSRFEPRGSGIVVTGAGNGIGAALARELAARGARVVVSDIDAEGARDVAAEIAAAGGCAVAVAGDAASEDGVTAVVDAARTELGSIDAWYANAGVDRGRGLPTTEADWETSLQVNLLAQVRAARLLVPLWTDRGTGRFVVTASAAGLLTMLDAPAYSVSKHAAVAFAEWLSITYRHRGVVVQAICPQGVRTRMFDEAGPLQDLLGRDSVITAEQVARAAADALAGDDFLILPHPQVRDYYRTRAAATDDWLRGMNRLQQRLEEQEGVR